MDAEKDPEPKSDWGVVCPKCILRNDPQAAFCADCGAPIGMVANVDPIQHILAEGFGYRSAVDGPPSLIVLIGVWLLFAPMIIWLPYFAFWGGYATRVERAFHGFFFVAFVVILYRATRNYRRKRAVNREQNS
jgi:hypothetical protein